MPARLAALACLLLPALALGQTPAEKWRPRFHFTPPRHWINDPNGLVYHAGEWHLFYQYNPFGDQWGHMSWGHAVSRDLFAWEHLPVAIPEAGGVMAFSGSAVVDRANTSGLGRGNEPPLVAVYTGHHTGKPLQDQRIASSTDRGRTWATFPGNPVLDIGAKDFRDPKVFWHPPSKRWVMAVAWPNERKVRLYTSADLKAWAHLSDFGPAGAVGGIWECPDLFPLAVEGSDAQKWVLVVNISGGTPAGGSGCQYFVGDFDGTRFTAPSGPAKWADWGRDFYAAVSWSDVPASDGRRIWLAWMSNWEYAGAVPTSPWRGAMTVPRELSLRRVGDDFRLVQRPVRELDNRRGPARDLPLTGTSDIAGPHDIEATLSANTNGPIELLLTTGANEETVLRIDATAGKATLDRTRSGRVDFHKSFPAAFTAPVRSIDGKIAVRLLLDSSSVEVFLNDGEGSVTALVLPEGAGRTLAVTGAKGSVRAWAIR